MRFVTRTVLACVHCVIVFVTTIFLQMPLDGSSNESEEGVTEVRCDCDRDFD